MTEAYKNGMNSDTFFIHPKKKLDTEEQKDHYAGHYATYYKLHSKVLPNPEAVYLVARIFTHACRWYEHGWDFVMECYSPEEIWKYAKPAGPIDEVIKRFAEATYLEVLSDRRNDALAAGGLKTTDYKDGISS